MSYEELLKALNRLSVETGSLACLGCGYEHNCGIHGCAILRTAASYIKDGSRLREAYDAVSHDLAFRTKQVRQLQEENERLKERQ